MHSEPQAIFHRDIRWENVVKSAKDRGRWILIDWDDASSAPTQAAVHLDKHNHAPGVFLDGHGGEVDVWGVGLLIVERSRSFASFPLELRTAGKQMQSGEWDVSESIEKINSFKDLMKDNRKG